ncbi:MAG: potassium transporter TrkG, partial [Thermodesulfobacteriota bacterium]|nr:potassium transporter TrkG [Thermodesulfobacteriota bacterium]
MSPLTVPQGVRHRVTPPQALVFSFAALIGLGTLTLMLPCMTGPAGMDWVDAFFTATSAVCVTGLVVRDTGTAFALPGQVVILVLIQLGGLGIMTFSVFFYRLAGREISLRDELAVRENLTNMPTQNTAGLVRSVVLLTLAIEGLGALFFFLFWVQDHTAFRAAFLAVFHAVSAFCNAGFSPWSDSLARYETHLGINLIFIVLIAAGGLGFVVLRELGRLRPKASRLRLSLHAKVVCWTTLILVISGMLFFLVMEWDNVLGGLGFKDKVAVSLFQAITPRTAGFSTVDFAHLTNTSLLATIFFMFIGGSPGSTAGGIKTVTLALIIALALSRYRGFSKVNLFRRSVSGETVTRGLTITLLAISIIGLALGLLLTTETAHLDHSQTRDMFFK